MYNNGVADMWRVGREVRHGSAKPSRRERYPYAPPHYIVRASGGIGIHGGLKIRAFWHEGSIPSSPTSYYSSG